MIDQVCLNEVLLESAREVFETMVFMPLDKSHEPNQEIARDALLGSITFKGTLDGCLAICCSLLCASAITQNMLGMDTTDEVTEAETSDAIGEVVNMVMGRVKSRIHESTGNLEVSIPSVVGGRELENSLGEGASEISIEVNLDDNFPARLTLLYRGSV